jgi:hypothetical protein
LVSRCAARASNGPRSPVFLIGHAALVGAANARTGLAHRVDAPEDAAVDEVRGMQGRGFWLCSATKRLMAARRSTADRNTPFMRRRRVGVAKKPSTAFSHAAAVGVTWERPAPLPFGPGADLGVRMGGVVVEDDVRDRACGDVAFQRIAAADEPLMAVALPVLAHDGAVDPVQRGERRGPALALVIMGLGRAPALLQRQAGPGAVERSGLRRRVHARHHGMGARCGAQSTRFGCSTVSCRWFARPGAARPTDAVPSPVRSGFVRSGFPGAGKTMHVNHVLNNRHGRR